MSPFDYKINWMQKKQKQNKTLSKYICIVHNLCKKKKKKEGNSHGMLRGLNTPLVIGSCFLGISNMVLTNYLKTGYQYNVFHQYQG